MLRVAAVLAALAIGIAGCGGSGDDDDSGGGGGDAKKVTEAKASGERDLVHRQGHHRCIRDGCRQLQQGEPGRERRSCCELPEAADLQREQQIQRLQAKSDECDVLGVDVVWTAEYAGQGWLQDVTDAVEKRKDEFVPSTLDTRLLRGQVLGDAVQHERWLPLLPR